MGYFYDLWNLKVINHLTSDHDLKCHRIYNCESTDELGKINTYYNSNKYFLSWLLIYNRVENIRYEEGMHGIYSTHSSIYNYNRPREIAKLEMVACVPHHFSKFDSYDRIKSYK